MKKTGLLLLIALSLSTVMSAQIRNVIIDADTDNELDDLLAITAAFKSEKLEIIGLTAAQWDGRNQTEEEKHQPCLNNNSAYTSWLLNVIILQLLDRDEIPALKGSEKKYITKGEVKITNLVKVKLLTLSLKKPLNYLKMKN